jgi:hypothetical protein
MDAATGNDDDSPSRNKVKENNDGLEENEISWALPVAATTATSRTSTPFAELNTTSTDAVIHNLASFSAAAASVNWDRPDETQLYPTVDAKISIQQLAGMQESQEELSLHIQHKELACLLPTPLVPQNQHRQ